jgi:hypothetical protein
MLFLRVVMDNMLKSIRVGGSIKRLNAVISINYKEEAESLMHTHRFSLFFMYICFV